MNNGQELTLIIFGTTILGSVIVVAVVEKLKDWFHSKNWVNTLFALAVGVLLGAAAHFVDRFLPWLIEGQILLVPAMIQGFFSGLVAAGLWKWIKNTAARMGITRQPLR